LTAGGKPPIERARRFFITKSCGEGLRVSAAGPRTSGNPAASCERKSQKGGSDADLSNGY